MGFGLVIGLTELLQLVTTSNYNAISNLTTLQITIAHSLLSSLVITYLLLGSSFRQCVFPSLLSCSVASVLAGWQTDLQLSHSVGRPAGHWSSLYNLGSDHTGNTTTNSSSIVLCLFIA
jgi:hypothetical protein